WSYEASITYGDTSANAGTTGQLFKVHLADALGPSMRDSNGVPICVRVPGDASTQIIYMINGPRGNVLNIPCVPLNLFAGSIPLDQLKGVTYTDAGIGEDSLTTFLGTASGRIAKLPNHGDISASVGADYRNEIGSQAPPSVASSGDTTDNLVQA